MKIFIVARNQSVVDEYKKHILKSGFGYTNNNPDIILSLGGDGTYLIAEHKYPAIPKLLIRDSNICNKCSISLFDSYLLPLKDKNRYTIEEMPKIEAAYKKNEIVAANDFTIRNKDQRHALRFRIRVDNMPYKSEFIGDGVVIATPWGSSGYFYNITKGTFKKGIGIALNNVNSTKRELIVGQNSKIDVEITRGDAIFSADNHKKEYVLKTGDKITIRRHKKPAKIVLLKKK